MAKALVTGATGFVGWHIAKQLLERGDTVRCLVRSKGRIGGLEAEEVLGDLRDRASVEASMQGCDIVYHAAADYRLWAKRPQDLFDSNVGGTENVLNAAESAGVGRVVYTSTVGCIGFQEGSLGDENSAVVYEDMTGAYKQSKFKAEEAALRKAATGYPVVIVNPTAPVGDHDVKPTDTGKIILDFLKKNMPAYIETGLNFVDVRDVARGHLLAAEKGRSGQRYILGAQNLTLEQVFTQLESLTGIAGPKTKLPYGVAYAAGLISTGWSSISGKEPRAPIDAVRMAKKKMWVSHAKAARELGFAPGPVEGALQRAVDWFRENGYVA